MNAIVKKISAIALFGFVSSAAFALDTSYVGITGVVGQSQSGVQNTQVMDLASAKSSYWGDNHSTLTAGNISQAQSGVQNVQTMRVAHTNAVPFESAIATVNVGGTLYQNQSGVLNAQHMRVGNVD